MPGVGVSVGVPGIGVGVRVAVGPPGVDVGVTVEPGRVGVGPPGVDVGWEVEDLSISNWSTTAPDISLK